jgi:hypothetical protein
MTENILRKTVKRKKEAHSVIGNTFKLEPIVENYGYSNPISYMS